MTYRPAERVFLAPWTQRWPAYLYLGLALALGLLVFVAETSGSNSQLYVQVIEANSRRLMTPRTAVFCLGISASASVLRAAMRGVRLRGDGVEYRDMVGLLIPRIRRIRWAQIDRLRLDSPKSVGIDLWDGRRVELPRVADTEALRRALARVAAARSIPVKGTVELDELPDAAAELDEVTG